MSRKKVIGIALLIGAIIVFAGGGFTLHAGHIKTGWVLFALGVIAIAIGLVTFFSRFSTRVELWQQFL